MFVSDVRPSEDIYSYNSIRLNVLRKEAIETARYATKQEMTKAISDMAKDFSLKQYQYFVGKKYAENKDGIVFRTGKNFAL